MPAILSVVGHKNSGKTTLIEKLLPLLTSRGLAVCTIKHDAHQFEIDHEGTDSYRHKQAGAQASAIVSANKMALVRDMDPGLSFDRVVEMLGDPDLVITEGYKSSDFPKIEVWRAEIGQDPLGAALTNRFAVYSPDLREASVPIFRPGGEEDLVNKILERFEIPRAR